MQTLPLWGFFTEFLVYRESFSSATANKQEHLTRTLKTTQKNDQMFLKPEI